MVIEYLKRPHLNRLGVRLIILITQQNQNQQVQGIKAKVQLLHLVDLKSVKRGCRFYQELLAVNN